MSPQTSGVATARSQSAQRRRPQDLAKATALAVEILSDPKTSTAAHDPLRLAQAERLTR